MSTKMFVVIVTYMITRTLQRARLCQALNLVFLVNLRQNHTHLTTSSCRTTSVTMFALGTERITAHLKVIVASVSTRMSEVRLVRETVRHQRVSKCVNQ